MTELQISDSADGLVFRASLKSSVTSAVLTALATAVCSDLAGMVVLSKVASAGMAMLAGSCAFFGSRRVRRFELRVTRLDFTSVGRIGDNFGQLRSVSSSEVQRLEYQPDNSGPETAHHPGGLYAIVRGKSICLLPEVDEAQTASAMDRIENRFPDLRAQWNGQSAFGKSFVQLELDKRNR